MYNRYIPQPDGSYRRNRIPDQSPAQIRRSAPPPPPPNPHREPKPADDCPPAQKPAHRPSKTQADSSVTGFLKQLLPKGFDTGDLLIVLLILLMAGSCEEEQNTALLTLALYLFM